MTEAEGKLVAHSPTLRVSDDERARAAGMLDAAVADGRITWEEHFERTGAVWAARTRADLAPQVADVPERMAQPPAPPQRVVAVVSKVNRTPEPSQPVHATALFGAAVLDLTGMQPGERVTVQASSFCGKVVVHVAEDAVVLDDGFAFLGKRAVHGTAAAPGGPVVQLTGCSMFGHVRVVHGTEQAWLDHQQRLHERHHRHDWHHHRDRHHHDWQYGRDRHRRHRDRRHDWHYR